MVANEKYIDVFERALGQLVRGLSQSDIVAYLQAATSTWPDGVFDFTALNNATDSKDLDRVKSELLKLIAQCETDR